MIELGQYDYIYTIIPPGDDDTPEIDDRGAAYEIKGVYGSDIGVTSTEKNSAFKGTFEECEKGNWSISILTYQEDEAQKYVIGIGLNKSIEALPATSIGQIDGTTVYEAETTGGYTYKLLKEIETTISDSIGIVWNIPATSYLTIYVASAEQLSLDEVKPIFNSVTYIDPQKISLSGKHVVRSSQEFSTQWGKNVRAGVEVTLDAAANGRAQYFGETGFQGERYYYGSLDQYTFTPYIDMKFLNDYEYAYIFINTGTVSSFYVIGADISQSPFTITEEVPAGQQRCFPAPTDPDLPSDVYSSLGAFSGNNVGSVEFQSIDLSTAIATFETYEINPDEATALSWTETAISLDPASYGESVLRVEPPTAQVAFDGDYEGKVTITLESEEAGYDYKDYTYKFEAADTSEDFSVSVIATSGEQSDTVSIDFTAEMPDENE